MANYVFIAASLDGYIATKDGGIDWLHEVDNPEGSDFGYNDFVSRIDAIVMGKNTYEKVLSFDLPTWPYAKPVFVASSSEIEVPEELSGKVKRVSGTPEELVAQIKTLGYENLYIDGGLTIQSFLESGLIDEMTITRLPVLLGDGIPLFGKLSKKISFTHVKTEVMADQLVMSCYEQIKN